MCVSQLNNNVMYKKAAENLVVLDFCINTHTHTHTQFPLYYKITTGQQAVVMNVVSRNHHCGSMLYVCHPDRAKRRKDLCIHSLEMLDFLIREFVILNVCEGSQKQHMRFFRGKPSTTRLPYVDFSVDRWFDITDTFSIQIS